MSFRKNESGQILVLTALCMTVIFGFVALAIDVGLLFNAKRKLQNAADAAATSAAIDYMFNASQSTARTAANNAVTANLISGATVTVNFNPSIQSAYHTSNYYVQVILSQPDRTFLMGMFNHRTMNIGAMAIAGLPGGGNACVIVLNPTESQSLYMQGSFNVSADKCGVVVDSSASDALYFQGGAGSLKAGYVSVVGGADGRTTDSATQIQTGTSPVINPFPTLNGPDATTNPACTGGNVNTGSSYTSTAGLTSVGGITCFSNNVTLNGFQLPAGLLVFKNGVTLKGNITSDPTSGTTLDVWGGSFNVDSKANPSLVAPDANHPPVTSPSSDAVPSGIAIMQPARNTNQMQLQFGASCGGLTGIVYAPAATVFLQDSGCDSSGGITLTTDLIVNKLNVQTTTLTLNSYTTAFGNASPLTAVALVE
jgi:hypothetical protein